MTAIAPARFGRVTAPFQAMWRHPLIGPALKVVIAYVLLIEVANQILFGRIDIPNIESSLFEIGRYEVSIPRGTLLGGAVIGALYGLIATGIILVYRANRIINFAQAQLGAVPAVVCLLLIARRGWPYLVALPLMLIGAAILGAFTEVALIRRFSKAPRLILTVVTIGVGFLLLIFEFYAKQWVGGELKDVLSLRFPTPFQRFTFHLGPSTLTGDHFFALTVGLAVVLALATFFRYTDVGIAIRASAENSERAALLGIPVARVSTIVWMLAAVLSAIGIFLRTPLIGLPFDGFVGPAILLLGLAAAVIARMESMPLAFFAGMFIGVIERSAVFATRRAALGYAVMFIVIVVALLVQRGKLSRAMEGETSTWQTVKEYRPIPAELRRLPEVIWGRIGIMSVVGALVLAAPWLLGEFETPKATVMVLYAIIGVSLVILTGWAGQISLGQYAIAGIGSAVAGGLAANHNWDFFAAIFVGAVAGALVAVIVGLPALRIQGLFLAVTTLSFAFAVNNFVLRREFFGWLVPEDRNFVNRPKLWGRIDLETDSKMLWFTITKDAKFYFVCLAFLGLVLAMARSLRKNRSGRIFIGVRDNNRLMNAYGVNAATTRLAAFAISGFLAGLAGALLAYHNTVFTPSSAPPETSIALFVMAVLGGVGSLMGALLGAVYFVGVPLIPGLKDIEFIELLTSGLGLLLILNFLPGGLAEGVFQIRDNILRRIAARRDILVPSLVADTLVVETADTEHVVEEAAEEHELVEVPMLVCPECGESVVLDEALLHPHFSNGQRRPSERVTS